MRQRTATPVVYGRPGCLFCAPLRLRLRLARIPFHAANIGRTRSPQTSWRTHDGGDELVPTVQIGSAVLSNPRVSDVRRALADRPA